MESEENVSFEDGAESAEPGEQPVEETAAPEPEPVAATEEAAVEEEAEEEAAVEEAEEEAAVEEAEEAASAEVAAEEVAAEEVTAEEVVAVEVAGRNPPTTSRRRRSGTSSTPTRGLRTRWRNRCAPLRRLRIRRQDRADPHPHRRGGGTAQRQEGHQQAPGLPGLRASGNGNERRPVARGEEHAPRHRFCGGGNSPVPLSAEEVNQILFRQASSAERPRPKTTFEKNDSVRIVEGPFANFFGQGGRGQHRARHVARDGHDFRPGHAGGTGSFCKSKKFDAVEAGAPSAPAPARGLDVWQRKLPLR